MRLLIATTILFLAFFLFLCKYAVHEGKPAYNSTSNELNEVMK